MSWWSDVLPRAPADDFVGERQRKVCIDSAYSLWKEFGLTVSSADESTRRSTVSWMSKQKSTTRMRRKTRRTTLETVCRLGSARLHLPRLPAARSDQSV